MPDCIRFKDLAKKATLEKAWRDVSRGRNPRLRGSDGIQLSEYEKDISTHLAKIRTSLLTESYSFGDIRPVPIPKRPGSSEKRPLGIHNHGDRIVQRALCNLLVSRFDDLQQDCSYGFRKSSASCADKGVLPAARHVLKAVQEGHVWVFEADIVKFFDTVNRKQLSASIKCITRSTKIRELLVSSSDAEFNSAFLDAMTEEDRALFDNHGVGLPQGGIISPMLANHYLLPLDNALLDAGLEPIRYADDFVVLCKSHEDALRAHKIALDVMNDLGLRLHPLSRDKNAKTRIIQYRDGFEFLGLRFEGSRVKPSSKAIKKHMARIDAISDESVRGGFLRQGLRLDNALRGWAASYRDRDIVDTESAFDQVNRHALKRLVKMLRKCGLLTGKTEVTKGMAQRIGINFLR